MPENRTSSRKTRVGLVVSDKMDKTVVVAIADRVACLLYTSLGESKYGMIGETCALSGLESRKGRDPKLLALQELCQRCAPDNRVSLCLLYTSRCV